MRFKLNTNGNTEMYDNSGNFFRAGLQNSVITIEGEKININNSNLDFDILLDFTDCYDIDGNQLGLTPELTLKELSDNYFKSVISNVTIDSTGLATDAKLDEIKAVNTSIHNGIGDKDNAAASTDTGTFSLISLFKRLLQRITSLLGVDFATQTTLADIKANQTNGTQKVIIADATDTAAIVTGPFTNVKGLRVYGGPTDPISDIPVYIAYDHHQIHEGEMYKYTWQGALNSTTKDFRISVPNLTATTRTPHFLFEIVSNNTTCNAFLYEGTTWTATGTDDSSIIYNRNRNSLNTAGTKIYVSGGTALTTNSLGTLLDQNFMFANKPASNYDRNMSEWDLKTLTEYLLRVTTTGNGTCQIKMHWYEDLGV